MRGLPVQFGRMLVSIAVSSLVCASADANSPLRRLPPVASASSKQLPLDEPLPVLLASSEQPLLYEPPHLIEPQNEYTTLLPPLEDIAWTKGDYRIVPYGSLWGSASYDTGRTSPGPFVLFVPSRDVEGEPAFNIDTRRTRLGLDVIGPNIRFFNNAKSGGKVEIDFHGAFVIENKPGVLLRHAYGEIYDDEFRLLAGQYWDLISPLNPGTLSYSVGWGGGNIGFRRMQVRLERNRAISDRLLLVLQASINQNIVSDFQQTAGVETESSGWPVLQGRLAVTREVNAICCLPITVGVSGHIGEEGFDFTTIGPAPLNLPPADDARVKTWSLNVDLHAPITDWWGVQGEFFTGLNLDSFLGGAVQGVDLTTREGIHSTGGWLEIWYDWTTQLHSRTGYGIDDPRNSDLFSGRTHNKFLYVNSSFDVTEMLNFGVEVTYWKTLYLGNAPGESVRIEFAGRYDF